MWYRIIYKFSNKTPIIKKIANFTGDVEYQLPDIYKVTRYRKGFKKYITYYDIDSLFQITDKEKILYLYQFDNKNVLKKFILSIREKKIKRVKNII